MKHNIDSFTRGIHNKLDPMYLRPDEVVDCNNVDIRKGTLTNSKGILWSDTSVTNPVKVLDKNGTEKVLTSSTNNMVKQLHSRIYSTDIHTDTNIMVHTNNTDLILPLPVLTESDVNITYEESTTGSYLANDTNHVESPTDTYFAVTKFHKTTGYESAPIYKTIVKPGFAPLPKLGYDVQQANAFKWDINQYLTISQSKMLDYIQRGIVRLTTVRGAMRTVGDHDLDMVYTDACDMLQAGILQERENRINKGWAELQPYLHIGGIIIECVYQAIDDNPNVTDTEIAKILTWLYDHKVEVCNRFAYNYEFVVDRWLYRIDYVGTPLPDDYEYRVYLKGVWLSHANTDYLLAGTSHTDQIVLLASTSMGEICATQNQLKTLSVSMFAVSTSNLWLVETGTNKIYFTQPGTNDIINNSAYVSLPTLITGVHFINNVVVVFCADNSIHTIGGTDPTNITLKRISDDVDCVHVNTIARVTQTLVWLSTKGLCITNGYTVQLLRRNDLKEDTFGGLNSNTQVISSASVDDYYYLLLDGTIYQYNIRTNVLLKHGSHTSKKLWLYKGDIWAHNGSTLAGKLFSNTPESLEYITGNILKPGYTTHKEFQYFRVTYTGTPTLVIYMDSIEVNTIILPNRNTVGHEQFQISQGVVGYSAHIKILGLCTIHNIQVDYNYREEQ